jgi:hypothetical protein
MRRYILETVQLRGKIARRGKGFGVSGRVALWLAGGAMVAALFLVSACGAGEEELPTAPATSISATATPATALPATATPTTPLPATATPAPRETPEAPEGGGGAGIGIYPSTVEFGQTLRGSQYFRTVGVMNSGDSEQTFRFDIDGDAAPWLSLVNPQDRAQVLDTVAAAPHGEARAFLRLQVPEGVPNGTYTGAVTVLTSVGDTGAGEGAGASVSVGAELEVTLEVTGTQSIAGSFTDAAAMDVEVGSPLRIRTTIQNSGNVQVNPQIALEVADPTGAVVAQTTFSGEVVYPNETKVLVSEWDTTGQALGGRVARVGVKFGDLDLGSKQANFNILAVGTLTRQGTLEGITLENAPYVGVVAKIGAHFRNTGQIDTRATFLGEVYYKSALIDTISTPERLVQQGEAVAFEAFVDVPDAGTYTVKGKVNYEGKETEEKELTFDVGGLGGGEGLPLWAWIVIGGGSVVGAVVVVGGSWVLARRLLRLFRL